MYTEAIYIPGGRTDHIFVARKTAGFRNLEGSWVNACQHTASRQHESIVLVPISHRENMPPKCIFNHYHMYKYKFTKMCTNIEASSSNSVS